MFKKVLVFAGAVIMTASVALAGTTGDRKDLQLFKDIAKSVNRYPHFTIFDDVNATVTDGVVTLSGKVTMPYKRDDIMKRVADVASNLRNRTRLIFCSIAWRRRMGEPRPTGHKCDQS